MNGIYNIYLTRFNIFTHKIESHFFFTTLCKLLYYYYYHYHYYYVRYDDERK